MTATAPHEKARGLKPSSPRPAKVLCSECGLCDTYYVKETCAFLNQQVAELGEEAHGRSQDLAREDERKASQKIKR